MRVGLSRTVATLFLFQLGFASALWWSLGDRLFMDHERICRNTRRLSQKQLRICKREPAVVEALRQASITTAEECEFQFRHRRWNCTRDRRLKRRILMRDTAETAALNSLMSAAVTYEVTRSCSRGDNPHCSCCRETVNLIPYKKGKYLYKGCNSSGKGKKKPTKNNKRRKKNGVKEGSTAKFRDKILQGVKDESDHHLHREYRSVGEDSDSSQWHEVAENLSFREETSWTSKGRSSESSLPWRSLGGIVRTHRRRLLSQGDLNKDAEDDAKKAGIVEHWQTGQANSSSGTETEDNLKRSSAERTAIEWHWEGCFDNIQYGYRKSKQFLDFRYRVAQNKDAKTLVMLHNNKAGRLAVRNNLEKVCRCHGLSASCVYRTCWLRMPSFRVTGEILKERYDNAVKVIASNDGASILPEDERTKKPRSEDLVYLEKSFSYCNANRVFGSLGTQGRECQTGRDAKEGTCRDLCCGRGHMAVIINETKPCRCYFEYCCEVRCEKCSSLNEVKVCK